MTAQHPRATMLRMMLMKLFEHRRERAKAMPTDLVVDASEWREDSIPPRWISHIVLAERDATEAALRALIREEGWRAYAEGGLEAMHRLCDDAAADYPRLLAILDHRWDGIGTERRGVWVA